jgi:uncharacterized protein
VKTKLVVIQPTPFCNINCRYCYLPHRSLNRRIAVTTLEQIFKVLFSSAFIEDSVSVLWHAGEPLILPVEFYRQAFHIQQKWNAQNVRISNSFQTNATLITQEWCDFILEHGIRIGVSIDGPAYLHDAHRVDRKNRGTFERVMRGIALLRKNDIPYTAIAVVTSDTVEHPDGFWQFFQEIQPTRLGLNPEEVEGCNEHSSLHTSAGIERYKRFLQRLMELNEHSPSFVPIREIDVLLQRIQSGQARTQTDTNTPMAILSFDYAGNISTFSPELLSFTHPVYGSFAFGNVFDTTLEDIFTHEKFVQINSLIQRGITRCQESCEYFSLCGGGAPSNKLHENGTFDSAETNACRLRIQVTTDVLLACLEERYNISPCELDELDES